VFETMKNKKIPLLLILILSLFKLSYSEEDLFKIAKIRASSKTTEKNIGSALKFYNDGLYSKAIETASNLINNETLDDLNYELINFILVHSLYKSRQEEKMLEYVKNVNFDRISQYGKYRIYQVAMLLFLERKYKEGQDYILEKLEISNDDFKALVQENESDEIQEITLDNKKEKVEKLVYSKDIIFFGENTKLINYKGVDFILNKDIFKLDPAIPVIGELSIYIAEKDQTMFELAKTLDLGYYELKNANPLLDPFDIRKNQIVVVPLKRILPVKNFKYGTIYINIYEKRLYYPIKINEESYVITYPIGIGTDDAQSPIGEFKISQKRKDPAWYPPESIRKEQPDLPPVFPPGPDNPLGTRAMRLGNTSFLMHGTNKEYGIGMKVSHGCIRMYNEDVEKLFEVVDIGTPVVSREIPYKIFVNSEKVVEVFDNDAIKELERSNIVSKRFLEFYKTDLFGKSFAIKVW
jgi:lipoprotein-anchoring transpeptidase ErfK/SrfK